MIGLLFSRIEDIETELNTDIVSMTEETIAEIMQSERVRTSRYYTSLCILKSYAAWCVKYGLADPDSGLLTYAPEGLDETRRKTVSGAIQLNNLMDKLFSPVDRGEMDNLIRVFLWMVFAGIPISEAEVIHTDDVDLTRMTVRSFGREYGIHRLSVPSFRFVIESDKIRIDHPQYQFRKRIDSPMLLRGSRSDCTAKYLAGQLRTAQMKGRDAGTVDSEITATSIYWSGRYSDMYIAECAGVFPDFSANVDDYMDNARIGRHRSGYQIKDRSTEDAQTINKRYLRTMFMEDYSRWKLAFMTL